MRKDVKVGLVLSLVLVVLAAWYFVGRDKDDKPVPITDKKATADKVLADAGNEATPKAKDRRSNSSAKRPVRPKPKATSPNKNRTTPSKRATPDRSADGGSPVGTPSAKRTTPVPTRAEDAARETAPKRSLSDIFDRRTDTEDPSKSATVDPQGPPGAAPENSRVPKPRVQIPPGAKTHVVGDGDTLAILAELYYGSQRHAELLLRANPQITEPTRLIIGTKLVVPPLGSRGQASVAKPKADKPAQPKKDITLTSTPAKEAPAKDVKPTPTGNTYTVKAGDSFWKIAQTTLGDPTRWPEVFELNKDAIGGDASRLKIGQVLKLPPKVKPTKT